MDKFTWKKQTLNDSNKHHILNLFSKMFTSYFNKIALVF